MNSFSQPEKTNTDYFLQYAGYSQAQLETERIEAQIQGDFKKEDFLNELLCQTDVLKTPKDLQKEIENRVLEMID